MEMYAEKDLDDAEYTFFSSNEDTSHPCRLYRFPSLLYQGFSYTVLTYNLYGKWK